MALTDLILPAIVLIVVIYLGLKIIKNVIVTIILVALLLAVLYYFGYLVPFGL